MNVPHFDVPNSFNPSSIIVDPQGDVFGTSVQTSGDGVISYVFEIYAGQTSIEVLGNFDSTDLAIRPTGLTMDHLGNIYGTTTNGGADRDGTVFELPVGNRSTTSGSGVINTIATFDGTNGSTPDGNPVLFNGALYGVTTGGSGTVFKVTLEPTGIQTLATFDGSSAQGEDSAPQPGITVDTSGNIYGVTQQGDGSNSGGHDGTVFELAAGTNQLSTLATFDSTNGSLPNGGLYVDPGNGNLFGTTTDGQGTVFEVVKEAAWPLRW